MMEQCDHGGVKKWCPVCKSMTKRRISKKKTAEHTEGGNFSECTFCMQKLKDCLEC